MNLLNLFEDNRHPAYVNLTALQQAVKNNRDAVLNFGGESVTVDYPLARYIAGRYAAQQTGADRGRFIAALGDARKFDALAKEYRTMADQARLESVSKKKTEVDIQEADIDDADSARTQRMLRKLRIDNPQAKSDAEALAYALVKSQEKDQADIDRLEKELDDVEGDVKSELQKQISTLKQRRGKVQAKGQDRSATDDRQDALLKKLSAANAAQDQALNDLEAEIDQVQKQKPVSQQPTSATMPVQKQKRSTTAATTAASTAMQQKARDTSKLMKYDPTQALRAKGIDDVSPQQDLNFDPEQQDLFKKTGTYESLRPGEYHNVEVTFDDGSKETVKTTGDSGYRDQITQHFARQGRTVKDINIDWAVREVSEAEKKPKPTNPQLWGRAKAAAKSKFDVYPSAYANAWAAKWYKQHGGGWR